MFVDQIPMLVLVAFKIEEVSLAGTDEEVFPFTAANRSLIPKAEIEAAG